MTSKKNTNKALFSSVVALILCCSMLVGTTFAWFTDEVKSGVNQIVAGNLDVELYHQDKAGSGKVDTTTTLFDDVVRWEPGVVAYENLTVVNQGNLALKYELAINFTDAVKTPAGKTLADVLQVGVVPNGIKTGASREEVVAAVQNWQPMKSFIESGELLKQNDSYVYGIVIYWLPSANDNDYNMNNGQTTVLSINLGVNLHAWQKDHEEDSFNKEYDAVVHTETQLADALKKGGNIKVGSNIEATETIDVPAGVAATLDLNGKTLTGAILAPEADLTIANGTLKNEDSSMSALEINAGKLTLDNVQVDSARHGLRVDGNVEVTINGGTYGITSSGKTQHALNVSGNAKVTINGGTFVGPKGTTADSGAAVNVQAGATVEIYGGNFSGGKNNTLAAKGTLLVYGGTFDQDPSTYVAAGYVAVKNTDGSYIILPGDVAVTDTDALIAAIKAGETNIALAPGNYTMPTSFNGSGVTLRGKSLTITGTKGAVIEASHVDERDQYVTGADLKFEGVTLNFGTKNYMGFANAASLTYEDCAINGLQFCYGSGQYSFVNCDLNSNGAEHCVWTWGGQNVSFTDCDFTYGDRAVNCYGQGVTTNASFTNCTFTKVAGKTTTGAIETNSSALTALNLTITNCTVNEGDLWWISTWDSKGGANTNAVVDGQAIVINADQLAKAIVAGCKKIVLANDITVDKWIMYSETKTLAGKIITVNMNGLTIDGNGHTLTVNSIESGINGDNLFDDASNLNIYNLTIKNNYGGGAIGLKSGVISNVNFVGGDVAVFPGNGDITIENCTFATNGTAIYFEQERDNLTVTGCTFNQPDGTNVILLRGDVKFTGNTVNSGRTVNIVSGSPVVTGNNFNNVRLKVYAAATATVSGNTINNLVFEADTYASTFADNTLSTEAQAALNAVTKAN